MIDNVKLTSLILIERIDFFRLEARIVSQGPHVFSLVCSFTSRCAMLSNSEKPEEGFSAH